MAGLSQDELKALVQSEMRTSLGYNSSKLSNARYKSMYYYLGEKIGDLAPPEVDGRSSVISTDVRDTIEAMMPQLVVTFCGGDVIAEFEATQQDDEGKAKTATEYINYLFFKKNNGHKIATTWMKDALLQKNGIVKVWWDTRNEEQREEYKGLTDVELAQIMDDEEVKVTEQETYPDEDDAEQRQKAIEQLTQQLQPAMEAAQQGNPQAQQAVQQIQQQIQHIQAQPVKMLFDIVCKRTKTEGKIQIDNVPPEEFLISRNAKDIQSARFCAHRVQRTVSELKSMGYKNVDTISGDDQSQALNFERIERLAWNDENAYLSNEITMDDSQKTVWVTEAYLRADYDGDGLAELRKVTVAGNEILDNEVVDYTPFVSITPVPLPHTFFGLSIADLAMESQKTKTSILRAQLDNMYLGVNGRYYAIDGQVNLDDLLTSRPGGVVRIKQAGAVGRLDTSSGDVNGSYQLMEYMQQDLENRTGWSRQSMGNDAAGINTTATAANIVTNKADMRLDLIARNFADGFTELFKFMLKLVCQHQDKDAMVKLSGGWVSIDPREWKNQFDVNINVGIGMGNKDQKVQHMMALIQQQAQVFPLGVANPANVYNAQAELAKLLGYKNPDKFYTDPAKAPPQPPKPDPEQLKIQGQMQLEQGKAQAAAQNKQLEVQANITIEREKMQMQAQVDQHRQEVEAQQQAAKAEKEAQLRQFEAELDMQKEQAKLQHQMAIEQMKAQAARELAELNASVEILKAQISAKQASDAAMMAATQAADVEVASEIGGDEAQENPLSQLAAMHGDLMQGVAGIVAHLGRPKQIIRGPDGRATGVI